MFCIMKYIILLYMQILGIRQTWPPHDSDLKCVHAHDRRRQKMKHFILSLNLLNQSLKLLQKNTFKMKDLHCCSFLHKIITIHRLPNMVMVRFASRRIQIIKASVQKRCISLLRPYANIQTISDLCITQSKFECAQWLTKG